MAILSLPPAKRLLRLSQVLERFPVSKSQWYKGIRAGMYPKPLKLGKMSFWYEDDINALIEGQ